MNTKYINIVVIAVLMLSSLFVFVPSFEVKTATAIVVVESVPVIDGTITSIDGVLTGDKIDDFLVASTSWNAGTKTVSFIEWDISSIPDSATITNVGFNVYGDGYSTHFTDTYTNWQSMTIQPSAQTWDVAGWTAIYNDIWGAPNTIYKSLLNWYFTDNRYINLNDTGGIAWAISPKADLQTQLAADWFAIALAKGPGEIGYAARCDSSENTEGHIKPTLWIEYEVTTPIVESAYPGDGNESANLTTKNCINISYSQFSTPENYYAKITIDSALIENPLINFPILVILNSTVSSKCGLNGEHIRFTDYSNNTLLPFEIELFNPLGTSYIWVNVSHINGTGRPNTNIWLKYGNATWPYASDPKNTWDSKYVAVWHMNSTGTTVVDSSTQPQHNGTKEGATSPEQVSGIIGYAQEFTLADTEWISVTNHTDFYNTDQTIEYWVKPKTMDGGTINKNQDAVATNSWGSYLYATDEYGSYMLSDAVGTGNHSIAYNTTFGGGGSGAVYKTGAGTGHIGRWTKVTQIFTNYTTGLGGNVDLGIGFGRTSGGVKEQYFDGYLDEIRISSIRRNNSWLNASYHTQSPSSSLISYSAVGINGTAHSVNITWYWYNGTGFEEFYTTEGITANGTYCIYNLTRNRNLTPCTEYYWLAHVEDSNGNYTEDVFSFTTPCIIPPTDLTCSRINGTALNLTWTEQPAYNGTTTTMIRYQKGYSAPGIESGTLLYNATGEAVNFTGLDESSCYAISAWTWWTAPNGTIYLSANKATSICCTAGGDKTVYLRYENTSSDTFNNPINLTLFPYSTHRVIVKYTNGLEQTVYLNNESDNPFTVASVYNILYIEVYWNWSVNRSQTCNISSSYYRRLTPLSEENISGNWTYDFYFIIDKAIYSDYRYQYVDGNCSSVYETNINNLIKYDYAYIDITGQFMSGDSQNTVSTIYTFNATKRLVIHEDYLFADNHIYPTLHYGKNYWHNVTNLDDKIYSFIGTCPTGETIQNVLYMRDVSSAYDEDNVEISHNWNSGVVGGWLYYNDPDITTTSLYFTLFLNNTNTPIYYSNLTGISEWNFTAGTMATLDQSRTYIAKIIYVRRIETGETTYKHIMTTKYRSFIPGIDGIVSSTYIDLMFRAVFGDEPFYDLETGYDDTNPETYVAYSSLIVFGISLFIGLGLLGADDTGMASLFGAGATLVVLTSLISGLGVLTLGGVFLIVLGGIMLLGRRNNR